MQCFKTWQLFAVCVVVWGTTWHAITYQLHDFPAEVGVAIRFALAGAAVLALSRWRGVPLACSLAGSWHVNQKCDTGVKSLLDKGL